jgi:hypothetical protein
VDDNRTRGKGPMGGIMDDKYECTTAYNSKSIGEIDH